MMASNASSPSSYLGRESKFDNSPVPNVFFKVLITYSSNREPQILEKANVRALSSSDPSPASAFITDQKNPAESFSISKAGSTHMKWSESSFQIGLLLKT